MKITAIYLRVSTSRQDTEHQLIAAENYAAKEFSGRNTKVYEDHGVSGMAAVAKRPGLERLISDVKAGKVERIITFEFSRLSRDFMTGLNLMKTLADSNVPVFIPGEGQVKFDSAIDQFLVAVKAFSADSEREQINARIKSGLQSRKEKGLPVGAPKGNTYHRGKGSVQQHTKEIQEMRSQGNNPDQIAATLGVSKRSVFRALKASQEQGGK
jgi:site-specific DNA recombinase